MAKYHRSQLLSYACACALGLGGSHAFAQTAAPGPAQPSTPDSMALDEVVVTGSFLKGTAEDSAMPVEVITFEELQDLGRPSNLDLVKTMSESGGVAGENNRVNFYPIGAITVNLRSLGPRFTTVVFNGRRFPEQYSVNTGRFNNIAWIPNAALGGVETLKAGGGTTYGADAVAGVVNYITRKDFDGLELNADYRYIEDSDGDYNADMLFGKKWDNSNLMISLSYQHRSALHTRDRDWTKYHYLENPASYQFATFPTSNPGALVFQRPVAGTQTSYLPSTTATSDIQMGPTGIVRDLNCAELGGFRGFSPTGSPSCYTNTAEMEDLVSEQNAYNLYIEHNINFLDSLRLHSEVLLYRQDIPEIALSSTFVSNPAAWPLAPSVGGAPRQQQAVGTSTAYFVDGHNPAVGVLLNGVPGNPSFGRLNNSNGTPVFDPTQINDITTVGRVGLLNTLWKPFGNGGSPLTGPYDLQEGHLTMWRVSEVLSGDLPEFLGTSFEWEIGLTGSKISDVKQAQDMLVDRLQAALNGFGGANCNGIRADLGGSTCQYFNPFSSAIPSNYFTGAVNPGYVNSNTYAGYMPGQGLANDPNLIAWMYVPIEFERIYRNIVVDPIIRGDTGIGLPGGTIQMAFGGQFRKQDEQVLMDDYTNRAINPCPTLGATDCQQATLTLPTSQTGSLVYNRAGNIFGAAAPNYRPERRNYPAAAVFTEFGLPLLDNLNVNVAGRYEKFYSDVTDKDNSVFVPAASLKWDPQDWLGIRTSWGKTFSQVNPPRPRDKISTLVTTSAKYTGIAAYNSNNYANGDVESEKGEYLTIGFLVRAGNFNTNLDFYSINIDNYTRTMTAANVLDAAVLNPVTGAAASTFINCSSPVFTNPVSAMGGTPLMTLSSPCVQGTTTLANMAGANVNIFGANAETNSGTLRTSGIDLSASYRFEDVFGGSLTPSFDLSKILKWRLDDFVVGGAKLADGYDGLGYVNLSSGRTQVSVASWRGNFGVVYRIEGHTVNLQAQYVPSIINEDTSNYNANLGRNANIGDANGRLPGATSAACTTGSLNADIGAVPAGSGSGQWSAAPGATGRGACAGQNTAPQSGKEVAAWYNLDLIYRAELPANTALTLTINNLLDRDPSFFRGIVPYNTAYGSPLGRTVKLGASVRF